jgi:hypothetical protein
MNRFSITSRINDNELPDPVACRRPLRPHHRRRPGGRQTAHPDRRHPGLRRRLVAGGMEGQRTSRPHHGAREPDRPGLPQPRIRPERTGIRRNFLAAKVTWQEAVQGSADWSADAHEMAMDRDIPHSIGTHGLGDAEPERSGTGTNWNRNEVEPERSGTGTKWRWPQANGRRQMAPPWFLAHSRKFGGGRKFILARPGGEASLTSITAD